MISQLWSLYGIKGKIAAEVSEDRESTGDDLTVAPER